MTMLRDIAFYTYEADTHCACCASDRFGDEVLDADLVEGCIDNEGNPVRPVHTFEIDGSRGDVACGSCLGIVVEGDIVHDPNGQLKTSTNRKDNPMTNHNASRVTAAIAGESLRPKIAKAQRSLTRIKRAHATLKSAETMPPGGKTSDAIREAVLDAKFAAEDAIADAHQILATVENALEALKGE